MAGGVGVPRKISQLIVAGASLACSSIALAQAEPRVSVDVSTGGSVETNPFLEEDGETAGSAFIRIDPRIVFEDEIGRTVIEGSARFSQFTNRYGSDEAARLGVNSRRMLSERTTVRVGASAQTSRSAIQDALTAGAGDLLEPGVELGGDVPYVDFTLAGTRSRVTNLRADAGIEYSLDPVSNVSASLATSYSNYSDGFGFDFRDFSGGLGYSRRLSDRTTLTLGVQATRIEYFSEQVGDSTVVSAQTGVRQQISPTLTLIANVGLDFVNTTGGLLGDTKDTSLSGSIALCNRGLNSAMCVSAQRSARPTALGGVATVNTLVANYDVRLSLKDRLSLAGRYGQTDQSTGGGLLTSDVSTDLVGASARYTRALNDRLSFFLTPSFAKVFDDLRDRDANFAVMAGITMRFGSRQ